MGIVIGDEYKLEELKEIDSKYMNLLRVGEAATLETKVSIPPGLLKAAQTIVAGGAQAFAEAAEKTQEFLEAIRAAAEELAQAFAETMAKLQDFAEYEADEAAYLDGMTREEWREVEALDAQKAAARARSYAGALAIEKAREVRRRRKWRKRIDDRIHIVRG